MVDPKYLLNWKEHILSYFILKFYLSIFFLLNKSAFTIYIYLAKSENIAKPYNLKISTTNSFYCNIKIKVWQSMKKLSGFYLSFIYLKLAIKGTWRSKTYFEFNSTRILNILLLILKFKHSAFQRIDLIVFQNS